MLTGVKRDLQRQRDVLQANNQAAAASLDKARVALHGSDGWAQLAALEKRLRHYMQNTHAMKEFILIRRCTHARRICIDHITRTRARARGFPVRKPTIIKPRPKPSACWRTSTDAPSWPQTRRSCRGGAACKRAIFYIFVAVRRARAARLSVYFILSFRRRW